MDIFSLKDRRAVVTGGGSGLGFGIARAFIEAGAIVVIIGKNFQKLINAQAELGERCEIMQFDVTNLSEIPKLVNEIDIKSGPTDILVNCAGTHLKQHAIETSDADFMEVLNVHLLSVFALTREFVKGMVKRRKGNIILISSMSAVMGMKQVVAYSTGKTAIIGMMRSMVAELATDNIRINTIAPGWINTPMLHKAIDQDEPRKRKILSRIPNNTFGMPEDIGYAALYLASDASKYVNGVFLPDRWGCRPRFLVNDLVKIKMMEGQSRVRWTILSLLFFATTINYIDRQIIGLLKPYIEKDLNWDEADYGFIVTAFQIAYATGLLLSGRLLDNLGTRLGYTIAIVVWSCGAIMHAAVNTILGFGLSRVILGIGEAANFPAAVKTVAEWFPKRQRALATGLFNSGSNIGAIAAPVIVAGITINLGWKWAFIITGLLGFIWMIFWFCLYQSPEKHKSVSQSELAYILSDNDEKDLKSSYIITWKNILKYRQTYAICLTRFLTDWVWWFFLFWIPDFLRKTQHINLNKSVLPLICIYTIASVGGIFGGFLSSYFIKQGRSIDFSRKTTILICGLLVLPLTFAAQIQNMWLVIIIIGMAAAAHQAWASNIFTVVSDMYPKNVIGTVVGLSGFIGAIGGALAASFVGLVLKFSGSYTTIFFIASTMYISAWLILRLMIPRINPLVV